MTVSVAMEDAATARMRAAAVLKNFMSHSKKVNRLARRMFKAQYAKKCLSAARLQIAGNARHQNAHGSANSQ
jgi:hypothetical protein